MASPAVCNVQGATPLPDQRAAVLQPVPKATDLASALKAIQALHNNFNTLNNHIINNRVNITNNNAPAGSFTENRKLRTFVTVRVFNPDDKTQWVDVEQITGLTFVDKVSGHTLTWKQ